MAKNLLAQQGSGQYCIKRISVANMGRREREAAIREAAILKEFNHPNVVQYKEQFIENGTLYIVMEYAEDGDLDARLKRQRGRPLPPPQGCTHTPVWGAGARFSTRVDNSISGPFEFLNP